MTTTRNRILDATAAILREEGFAAATSKRIAAAAGVAEGSIFGHFGDKGRLLAAVLSYGLPEVKVLTATAERGAELPLRRGLTELVDALLGYYRASYPFAATALADRKLFEAYSTAHREAGSGPQQVWRMVHSFLAAHRDAGALPTELDVEIEALKLTGACQNAVWVGMVTGSGSLPHDGEGLTERLVESVLRTVRVDEPAP
jgi:AcrR family transcriptional regulator